MFKNKHVVIAMIVAPILAIIAYFATDAVVSETPHAAKQGESYQLVASSNCRYTSGICTLKNGDVEVHIALQRPPGTAGQLHVTTSLPAEGIRLAWGKADATGNPGSFSATDDAKTQWQMTLATPPPKDVVIRLVVSIQGTLYFAETDTAFFDYQTIFGEDFRQG